MPILGHPVIGPDRDRPEAVDDALETSTERLRDHLRRPHAGKRNHLTEHATYTVNRTVPERLVCSMGRCRRLRCCPGWMMQRWWRLPGVGRRWKTLRVRVSRR